MDNRSTNLREFLTRPNPTCVLFDDSPQQGKSTKNDRWPEAYPKRIHVWREFNMETIRKTLDGKLSECLKEKTNEWADFSNIHPEFSKIYGEDSLQSLIIKSHQSIVLEALQKTSSKLLGQGVAMVKGSQARLVLSQDRSTPDWGGTSVVNRQEGVPRPNNTLPGDTKSSRVWHSSTMTTLKKHPSALAWPLRQLLHYCISAFARYGYIITDQELFVIRVRCGVENGVSYTKREDIRGAFTDRPTVDYCAIPWEHKDGQDDMTINLALWALHILAANNGSLQCMYDALGDEKLRPREEQTVVAPDPQSFAETDPSSSVGNEGSFRGLEPTTTAAVNYEEPDDERESQDTNELPIYSQPTSFASTGSNAVKRKRRTNEMVVPKGKAPRISRTRSTEASRRELSRSRSSVHGKHGKRRIVAMDET